MTYHELKAERAKSETEDLVFMMDALVEGLGESFDEAAVKYIRWCGFDPDRFRSNNQWKVERVDDRPMWCFRAQKLPKPEEKK